MCISVSKKITRKLIGVCPLNLVLIISRSVFNIEKIWPNVQTPLCGKTTHYSLKIKFEPGLNTVVAVGEQEWSKIEAALYNTKINLSNKNCENRILKLSIAVFHSRVWTSEYSCVLFCTTGLLPF